MAYIHHSLLFKPGDKYGIYGENFVQLCDTEFHTNRAINVESTHGNFFSPEVKRCVDFHAIHIHLVIFLDIFCTRLVPNIGRKM